MNQSNDLPMGPMLLSLLIGAAAGALLISLNTHKNSIELRRQAKALARSSNRGAAAVAEDIDGLMDDWKERAAQVPGGPKRSMSVSVNDLLG